MARGPHNDKPIRLLRRLLETLRSGGIHSIDEQARVLAQCAALAGGMAGVMAVMDAQGKLH